MNMIPPLDYGESVEQQAFWGAISICVFSKECQIGDQPSKYISTALARLAVPLVVEGGVRSTQIINQSKYAAAMSEEAREEYFAGKAMYRKEGRFERWMLWHPNTTVPVLPGVTLDCSTHVCGIARHHGQGPKLSWACSRPLPHPHISHMIHQCGRILFYPGV